PQRKSRQEYPDAPSHLIAQVGDREVALSWNAPAGTISTYYIFRADSAYRSFDLIDSCLTTVYLDKDLINGHSYSYRIVARNLNGLQSEPSAPVSARPGLFSVLINAGALYANSSTVQLRFVAPATTRYVKVAADSLFTGAVWQRYVQELNWSFASRDGRKFVYATFLDGEGNQTGSPVADDIIVDTRASIISLNLRAKDAVYRTGDIVGIVLRTDEVNGNAFVDLGPVVGTLRLYDDGTHGDATAQDGRYSLDYKLPPCADVFEVPVVGTFTDIAGNKADPFTSEQTLTIENPPRAVILSNPSHVSNRDDALHLTWTTNSDADFSLYKLFRSNDARVDSSALLVAVFGLASVNHYVDSLLVSNHEYFYRLYVCDQRGLMSGSNIVSSWTVADAPPQAAILQPPVNVTTSSLLLSWNMNGEKDFADYRLFRGTDSGVDSRATQVSLISSRTTTQYLDTGLQANTTYWYRLYTRDQAGNSSASNPLSVTTLADQQPEAVLLAVPAASGANTLRLTWSLSRAVNFASYRIFRSTTQIIDGTGTPIVIINSISNTTHEDVGLAANTSYYYRVFVYDLEGRSTGSNLVYGITMP
ncbi:MAG TPA: fibronectin type III domain-containing protein, partial [bacterium]|nr:fibronectin type III domain-containing protein [bacterium]